MSSPRLLASALFSLLSLLLAVGSASLTPPAQASSERLFPVNVKRGTMVPRDPPDLIINGKPRVLASGARIRDENNHLQHLSAIHGEQFIVNYTENRYGDIDKVWILSPEEIRTPMPAANNATPTPTARPIPPQK